MVNAINFFCFFSFWLKQQSVRIIKIIYDLKHTSKVVAVASKMSAFHSENDVI